MLKRNIFLLCWIVSFAAQAQSGMIRVVEGKLSDANTREAVAFATVGIVGSSLGTSSNADGFFSIRVPAELNSDKLKIKISSIGYDNAVLENPFGFQDVWMKPSTTVLKESYIFSTDLTPRGIVKKAFSRIKKNYNTKPFVYKNFYRHYCKEDTTYGRLIEAATEVYKRKGYKMQQPKPGYKDEVRVTQLRRSLDKTKVSETHLPIALYRSLGNDFVGFQVKAQNKFYLLFPSESSILKAYLKQTEFELHGITEFDGQQVYEIHYVIKSPDSVTVLNVKIEGKHSGKLFINTKDFAFVKIEENHKTTRDSAKTLALYKKYGNKYYLYHSVRETLGKIGMPGTNNTFPHWSHIESITTDILTNNFEKFKGKEPTREELFNIPFDSGFWNTYNILKATPLEDKIVRDLSGGKTLNKQFIDFDSAERIGFMGGRHDEEKFNTLLKTLKGTPIYIDFWASWCMPCRMEMPASKALYDKYKGKIAFIYLSVDAKPAPWNKALLDLELKNGHLAYHLRVGSFSDAAILFDLKSIPRYVLIDRSGSFVDLNAKRPSDPELEKDFDRLIAEKVEN